MHTFQRLCPSHGGLHEIDCLCQNQEPECDSMANCIRCGETELGAWVYDEIGQTITLMEKEDRK